MAHMVAISGLAFTLIVIVIARSPYTHGNISPKGYKRTEIAHVGEEYAFTGLGLADPEAVLTGDPGADGFFLFFQYGCASCHGLKAEGGPVGPDLPPDISASKVKREVRDGPEGMPAYPEGLLSDELVEAIIAFLKNQ
jgi:hypothetical protein